jgi:hypothetical protein
MDKCSRKISARFLFFKLLIIIKSFAEKCYSLKFKRIFQYLIDAETRGKRRDSGVRTPLVLRRAPLYSTVLRPYSTRTGVSPFPPCAEIILTSVFNIFNILLQTLN